MDRAADYCFVVCRVFDRVFCIPYCSRLVLYKVWAPYWSGGRCGCVGYIFPGPIYPSGFLKERMKRPGSLLRALRPVLSGSQPLAKADPGKDRSIRKGRARLQIDLSRGLSTSGFLGWGGIGKRSFPHPASSAPLVSVAPRVFCLFNLALALSLQPCAASCRRKSAAH